MYIVEEKLLHKLADLAVYRGLNLKEKQPVIISSSVDAAFFTRICVEKCYEAGASFVYVKWHDDAVTLSNFIHADKSEFEEVPQFLVDEHDYYIKRGVARLNIINDVPGFFAEADSEKVQLSSSVRSKALERYIEYSMANQGQWTIVAVPSIGWAQKVFPDLTSDDAVKKLWQAILTASRVSENNDPLLEWDQHNARLHDLNEKLNAYNFKELHFKNELGTDVIVGLADEHRWAGGAEVAANGQIFNPNIPTEENFTMPHRERVNGKVVATKPLDYNGVLIEDFELVFKDGKVIDFSAGKNEESLVNLLNVDQGSSYIGEIALIDHDSPIQNTGLLFYNTLFDENASCHMALGAAYPMNIQGGTSMSKEELKKRGFNESIVHVDFMFGSAKMNIVGETHKGEKIQVFKNGNFVI